MTLLIEMCMQKQSTNNNKEIQPGSLYLNDPVPYTVKSLGGERDENEKRDVRT